MECWTVAAPGLVPPSLEVKAVPLTRGTARSFLRYTGEARLVEVRYSPFNCRQALPLKERKQNIRRVCIRRVLIGHFSPRHSRGDIHM